MEAAADGAVFQERRDLTDVDVLVQPQRMWGWIPDSVRKRLATDEDVELISAEAKDASDKGIWDVPVSSPHPLRPAPAHRHR